MAESFKQGVQALAESQPDSPEAFDEFIERYTQLARQTLAVH
jgi:phage-related tail protein